MLNIEVIKFEAQDVITTSVAAPTPDVTCSHDDIDWPNFDNMKVGETFDVKCNDCHTTGVGTLEENNKDSVSFTVMWN